jgi:hypothetical protein
MRIKLPHSSLTDIVVLYRLIIETEEQPPDLSVKIQDGKFCVSKEKGRILGEIVISKVQILPIKHHTMAFESKIS